MGLTAACSRATPELTAWWLRAAPRCVQLKAQSARHRPRHARSPPQSACGRRSDSAKRAQQHNSGRQAREGRAKLARRPRLSIEASRCRRPALPRTAQGPDADAGRYVCTASRYRQLNSVTRQSKLRAPVHRRNRDRPCCDSLHRQQLLRAHASVHAIEETTKEALYRRQRRGKQRPGRLSDTRGAHAAVQSQADVDSHVAANPRG